MYFVVNSVLYTFPFSFFLSQVKITYPGVNTDTICLKKPVFFRRIVFTFMNKTPLKEKKVTFRHLHLDFELLGSVPCLVFNCL